MLKSVNLFNLELVKSVDKISANLGNNPCKIMPGKTSMTWIQTLTQTLDSPKIKCSCLPRMKINRRTVGKGWPRKERAQWTKTSISTFEQTIINQVPQRTEINRYHNPGEIRSQLIFNLGIQLSLIHHTLKKIMVLMSSLMITMLDIAMPSNNKG